MGSRPRDHQPSRSWGSILFNNFYLLPKMKAFRLTVAIFVVLAVALPATERTFGPFKGNKNPMHAIMRPFMHMGKMISNSFKKGMKGISGHMSGSSYGPPKPSYGPPKPSYGPPKPSYGAPMMEHPMMEHGHMMDSHGHMMQVIVAPGPVAPAENTYAAAPAENVDSYGSPAAPVENVDSYGSPAAEPIATYGSAEVNQDSYGSPAAPVENVDSYGSPAAAPESYSSPSQDSYGSPSAPVEDSYGSPEAAPADESYGAPAA